MTTNTQLSHRSKETWKYALIGGLASIPFTFSLYWQSGMGNMVSLNMVFFGGVLTGFLARRGSARAGSAGTRAGLIGGLGGLVLILPAVLKLAANFGGIQPFIVAIVFVILFSMIFLGISSVVGLFGGKVGGWLSEKIGRQRTPGVGV